MGSGKERRKQTAMGASPLTYQHHLLLLFVFFLAHISSAREASAQHHSPRRHAVKPTDQAKPGETTARASTPASTLVLVSCADAHYPTLCRCTLTASRLPANSTSADLARAALSASLGCARRSAAFVSRLLASSSSPASEALEDCRDQLADSADLLAKTETELRHLRRETFPWQMDDALTWVSAAMTNQDTCVEGLQGGGDGSAGTEEAVVAKRVSRASRYTSNALYLINRLSSTNGRGLSRDERP
uniref:Pectinesterase inhibitor domain-containing protein n=1 Tax=Anthurium amnicola TaxID=1678845 RepID=A0A1D1YHU4_9ARAE